MANHARFNRHRDQPPQSSLVVNHSHVRCWLVSRGISDAAVKSVSLCPRPWLEWQWEATSLSPIILA